MILRHAFTEREERATTRFHDLEECTLSPSSVICSIVSLSYFTTPSSRFPKPLLSNAWTTVSNIGEHHRRNLCERSSIYNPSLGYKGGEKQSVFSAAL